MAIFPKPESRTLLPNCKFGTPDNFFLNAYSLFMKLIQNKVCLYLTQMMSIRSAH
ncbi:Uncharacterized protein dnm_029890 [Desulfonema magnum]|uniref:Uncharacterized protein n=1 Tax=Desulfonema magnum TaxID=45655 RepID=A0A975BJX4_9BACT|nr:Uncharacterized protein dnm_029890 [Desulfonema magnum]